MAQPYRLLFVCLGNICRSPSGENIMNHLIQQRGLTDKIVCDSAGTAAYHVGNPPDQRMTAAAQRQGIVMQGVARQFNRGDFEDFDLILAMDKENYRNILALDRQNQYGDKVKLMCQFCRTYSDSEVPDPYYGGEAGFNYVIDLLRDACGGLLDQLIETRQI
jgi:protein-tyrosine phosphatase